MKLNNLNKFICRDVKLIDFWSHNDLIDFKFRYSWSNLPRVIKFTSCHFPIIFNKPYVAAT